MPNHKVNTSAKIGFTALILANILWAAANPTIKLTLQHIPPYTFLFLRFLIVCVVLLPFTITQLSIHKVEKQDYKKIFILGLLAQSSIILVFLGLRYTGSIESSLIGIIGTLMTMFAGHYFFNEKSNRGVIFGTILALAGTLVVILEPLLFPKPSSIGVGFRILGNVLIFMYNMSFLLYILWSKISMGQTSKIVKNTLHFIHLRPMLKKYPVTLLSALNFYVGMVSMVPFALAENLGFFGKQTYNLSNLPVSAIAGLFYMAIFSSIVAYFLFEWALEKVSVQETALLGYIGVVFTTPFAYLLLGEVPTQYELAGACIIFTGVIIAEWSNQRHNRKVKTHL